MTVVYTFNVWYSTSVLAYECVQHLATFTNYTSCSDLKLPFCTPTPDAQCWLLIGCGTGQSLASILFLTRITLIYFVEQVDRFYHFVILCYIYSVNIINLLMCLADGCMPTFFKVMRYLLKF